MKLMPKPIYCNTRGWFESFILTGLLSSVLALCICIFDMIVFDRSLGDQISPWVVNSNVYLLCGLPAHTVVFYNYNKLRYFFKEYLPWMKHKKEYQEYHDTINLDRERKLTEVFISEVRRK